jgi:hypothetical protein
MAANASYKDRNLIAVIGDEVGCPFATGPGLTYQNPDLRIQLRVYCLPGLVT